MPTEVEEMIRRAREEGKADGLKEGREAGRLEQLSDRVENAHGRLDYHEKEVHTSIFKRLTVVEKMFIFLAGAWAIINFAPALRGFLGE